jgi:hypothetical protein
MKWRVKTLKNCKNQDYVNCGEEVAQQILEERRRREEINTTIHIKLLRKSKVPHFPSKAK